LFYKVNIVKKKFMKKRLSLQAVTSVGLPAVLVGGWFYPYLGFFLLVCMVGALALAWHKGRSWCDWMCPRGSFYDVYLKKISRGAELPRFMKTRGFRTFVFAALVSALGVQVYLAWGDPHEVGRAMVRVLTVTTTAGIVLGAFFQERAWCHICPMGSLGNLISRGKDPLIVADTCRSCKLCTKACPMQLKPFEGREQGFMADGDCLKCSSCVAACPANALRFEKDLKKAA
jgi:polyferredoxin